MFFILLDLLLFYSVLLDWTGQDRWRYSWYIIHVKTFIVTIWLLFYSVLLDWTGQDRWRYSWYIIHVKTFIVSILLLSSSMGRLSLKLYQIVTCWICIYCNSLGQIILNCLLEIFWWIHWRKVTFVSQTITHCLTLVINIEIHIPFIYSFHWFIFLHFLYFFTNKKIDSKKKIWRLESFAHWNDMSEV